MADLYNDHAADNGIVYSNLTYSCSTILLILLMSKCKITRIALSMSLKMLTSLHFYTKDPSPAVVVIEDIT